MLSADQFHRVLDLVNTSTSTHALELCEGGQPSASHSRGILSGWRQVCVDRPGSFEVLHYLELSGVAATHPRPHAAAADPTEEAPTASAQPGASTSHAVDSDAALCDDEASGPAANGSGGGGGGDSLRLYDFHIVHHPSYRVPVLSFRGTSSSGRPALLSEMQADFPAWDACAQQTRGGMATFVTQADHPVLQRPWFMLHPCETATLLTLLLAGDPAAARPWGGDCVGADSGGAAQPGNRWSDTPHQSSASQPKPSCGQGPAVAELMGGAGAGGACVTGMSGTASAAMGAVLEGRGCSSGVGGGPGRLQQQEGAGEGELVDVDDWLAVAESSGTGAQTVAGADNRGAGGDAHSLASEAAVVQPTMLPADAGDAELLRYMQAWLGLVLPAMAPLLTV